MKKAFGWIAGLAGIAALGRWLARRTSQTKSPVEPPAGPDPAEELRRRLDASREDEEAAPDTAGERTLEERRADVHVKAQEAIDAMRESGL